MNAALNICAKRSALLGTGGHLLILGGPGSGKTTIALVKAATELAARTLAPGQKILFLSFARATIARVMEQAKLRIPPEHQRELEINTYHGFAWSFIQTFGHLLTGYVRLRLLPPPESAGRMAGVPKDERPAKLRQLLSQEGVLGFDLFAGLAAELLEQSPRLSRLLSDSYPIIILDEFQDTNLDEWRMICALGKQTRIITLADAEQRIYEFRGATRPGLGSLSKLSAPPFSTLATRTTAATVQISQTSATICSPVPTSARATRTSRWTDTITTPTNRIVPSSTRHSPGGSVLSVVKSRIGRWQFS